MFLGHEKELESLRQLLDKKCASLVACRGAPRAPDCELRHPGEQCKHRYAKKRFHASIIANGPECRGSAASS